MYKIIIFLISIPKTLYFNFKMFPLKKAIQLPVICHYSTILKNLTGEIVLKRIGERVYIGFGGSYGLGGCCYFDNKGKIIFNGKASFARGTKLIVGKNGILEFGKDFRSNADCIFNCNNKITFGNDNLLAWRNTFLDSDGHSIVDMETQLPTNEKGTIIIGNHVWICPECSLLKGANIPSNSIIATKSVVTKSFETYSHVLIGCNKVLKSNIDWND